jgi:hypothetical protein
MHNFDVIDASNSQQYSKEALPSSELMGVRYEQ